MAAIVPVFVWATITGYHRLGGLDNGNLSQLWRPNKSMMLAHLVSSEGTIPGWQEMISSLYPHMAERAPFISSPCKVTDPIGF